MDKDLINRYYKAIGDADWTRYDEFFAPDAKLEAFGGVTGTGPRAMIEFDRVWKDAAPDFALTVQSMVAEDGVIMCEIAVSGHQTQVLHLPTGDVPPTGKELVGVGVGVFEVAGGRITAQRIYFDRMLIVEQLGL